jgi:hypothetical protein
VTAPSLADVSGLRHFGLATWTAPRPVGFRDEAGRLGKATLWLMDHRLPDGTWGGLDPQERFDTTLQVAQTLLMTGVAAESEILAPALSYLLAQQQKLPITFWRAGTLLNIPAYTDTVVNDLTFAWREPRLGIIGYPPALFLLKCVRFMQDPSGLPFTVDEALGRALADWTEARCWEDRASLTSLGMTLVYDLDFPDRDSVLTHCREFLLHCAAQETTSLRHGFAKSLAEDCYVIINVCETPATFTAERDIAAIIKDLVDALWAEQTEDGFWSSRPPFEGTASGGGVIHPTALAVRALASYYSLTDPDFVSAVTANLLERCAMAAWSRRRLYPLADELASVGAEDTAGSDDVTANDVAAGAVGVDEAPRVGSA